MAARALSFGIPVMNGKGQSDDHDDQNDEFIVAHSITPFEGQSQAPSISFRWEVRDFAYDYSM